MKPKPSKKAAADKAIADRLSARLGTKVKR
jgi:hypothetical protein